MIRIFYEKCIFNNTQKVGKRWIVDSITCSHIFSVNSINIPLNLINNNVIFFRILISVDLKSERIKLALPVRCELAWGDRRVLSCCKGCPLKNLEQPNMWKCDDRSSIKLRPNISPWYLSFSPCPILSTMPYLFPQPYISFCCITLSSLLASIYTAIFNNFTFTSSHYIAQVSLQLIILLFLFLEY